MGGRTAGLGDCFWLFRRGGSGLGFAAGALTAADERDALPMDDLMEMLYTVLREHPAARAEVEEIFLRMARREKNGTD